MTQDRNGAPDTQPRGRGLLLRELIRQAEKSVYHQLSLIEQQNEMNNHATRTSLALLTVMVSGTGLIIHVGLARRFWVLSLLSMSVLITAWKTALLILLYTGYRNPWRFSIGMAPRTLLRIAQQRDSGLMPFLMSALEHLASAWSINDTHLRELTLQRDRNIKWVFAAFGIFLSSIAYTLTANFIR